MTRTLLTLLICLFAAPVLAAEKLDHTNFEQFPILDSGRVKPLGAFAKARLKDFHGNNTINNQNATQWLAETIFNPAAANETKIFSIKNKDLKARLDLDKDTEYFNLIDLQNGLQKTRPDIIALLQNEQNNLTPEQNDLLKIHEDVVSYNELLRSFSLILPLNNDTTFQSLLPQEQKILAKLKSIVTNKGQDIQSYTADEQKTAMMGFQLQQIRGGALGNNDLKIIPSTIGETLEWIAPWQIINDGKGSPQTSAFLKDWEALTKSYRDNNTEDWDKQSSALLEKTLSESSALSQTRLKTELIYQSIKPYHIAMALYALSIALFLTRFKAAAFIALSIALSSHIFGIGARIYILDRPPVGTLYESVLFVSLICAALAAIAYIKNRKPLMPITGQIAAIGLLAIAPTMLQNNDSLELLVAVLNTNFWLATHVICITAGYGVCILAGSLAHAYMFLRLKNPTHDGLSPLFQSIHKISLIALLLTAVGTVLGGIWADQSWGRFWGWDPKENGALLIVLWLIWAQHGRLSGNIRPLGYITAIAALNIIVALAWFGVNLLGVGLHSYGFTSGIAEGLAIFCITETLLIITLWLIIRKRERTAA